jgi:IS30 family transposase
MGKTVPNQARKPRNCLSLKEKCRAIELLKDKKSEQFIATLLGVSKSQIHRLSVNKENVQKCFNENVFLESKKKLVNQSRNPELDDAVSGGLKR